MEATENQTTKSKREAMLDRLKGKYPEQQFQDDEELFGRISDDYDEYEGSIAKQKEEEKKIVDLFSKNPEAADFLMQMKEGKDPRVELVRRYGTDMLDEAKENPEILEEMAKANKEHLERVSEQKELEETYQKNLAESLARMDEIQERKGIDDEKMGTAMEYLFKIVGDGILGKFDEKAIEFALKANNYDADVAQAEMEGEVRGKNSKINEKLRKQKMGDGVPSLAGKNTTGMSGAKPKSLFDIANEAR